MNRIGSLAMVRVLAALVAGVLIAGASGATYAAMQSGGKGNLAGTVQTADGKPAVGLNLKLVKDIPIDMRRPGGSQRKTSFDSGATELQGGPRTKIIAQATTDAQGKFVMKNIDEGVYRLEAGNRNIGWIYQDVLIEANKTAELNDLKLAKPQ